MSTYVALSARNASPECSAMAMQLEPRPGLFHYDRGLPSDWHKKACCVATDAYDDPQGGVIGNSVCLRRFRHVLDLAVWATG